MAQILPDAASEALDFNNIKRRAIASRSYRVKLAPSNGSTFTPTTNSVINLDLPSNLAGTYVDFTQCYLKFKVTYADAATCWLDKGGAYTFFQRMQCVTSGQQIYDLNNYNVLVTALLDTDSDSVYKSNIGNVLSGLNGGNSRGERVNTGTRTYCLPFILHPFAMQKRLVPLFSLDSIRFRLTLESQANALFATGADPTYSISDVELCCYFTELSPSAQSQIDAMTGGVYNILAPSYMNVQTTMAAQSTAVTATLGVAVSSLERILVIHRVATSAKANQTIGARITNSVRSIQFFINSEAYPMRPIEFTNDGYGSEMLAEMLISDHALSDFTKAASIQNGYAYSLLPISGGNVSVVVNTNDVLYNQLAVGFLPGATNVSNPAWQNVSGAGTNSGTANGAVSTVGSFVAAIELESGVSAGKSDRIYSGISTMSSVVQYKGTYAGGDNTVACTIDFFCHYTILLTLNMRAMGVWTVSV